MNRSEQTYEEIELERHDPPWLTAVALAVLVTAFLLGCCL